jgi:hypothetical protein
MPDGTAKPQHLDFGKQLWHRKTAVGHEGYALSGHPAYNESYHLSRPCRQGLMVAPRHGQSRKEALGSYTRASVGR